MKKLLTTTVITGSALIISTAGFRSVSQQPPVKIEHAVDDFSIQIWENLAKRLKVRSVEALPTALELSVFEKEIIKRLLNSELKKNTEYVINLDGRNKAGNLVSLTFTLNKDKVITGGSTGKLTLERFLSNLGNLVSSDFFIYEEYIDITQVNRIPESFIKYIDIEDLKTRIDQKYISVDGTVNFHDLPIKIFVLDTNSVGGQFTVDDPYGLVGNVTSNLFISFLDSDGEGLFRLDTRDMQYSDELLLQEMISKN